MLLVCICHATVYHVRCSTYDIYGTTQHTFCIIYGTTVYHYVPYVRIRYVYHHHLHFEENRLGFQCALGLTPGGVALLNIYNQDKNCSLLFMHATIKSATPVWFGWA